MINPLLSLPGVYSFQERLRGRRGLFNEAKIVISFPHKELEQSEKSQGHEVGRYDQPRIQIKSKLAAHE